MAPGDSFQTVYPKGGVSGGAPAYETGELEQGIRPTRWQKFFEQVNQVSMDSPIGIPFTGYPGAWVRAYVQSAVESDLRAQNAPKITPQEANSRYPGMPVPFSEPVYPEIAEILYSQQQKRQKLQAWVDRGPEGTFLAAGAGIGAGVGAVTGFATGGPFGAVAGGVAGAGIGVVGGPGAATALDPVNLSLNFAGGYALRAAKLPVNLATTFGENLAGNLAADVPTYYQLKRELQEPNAQDLVYNAAAGAALGTGIHAAFQGIAHLTARAGKKANQVALREAVRQHEEGQRSNSSASVRVNTLRDAGIPKTGTVDNPYVYSEVTHPSERPYYVARDAVTGDRVTFGRDYGDGVHATDDGVVANSHAATPGSAFDGQIGEIRVVENAKFLDLSKTSQDKEASSFIQAIEQKFDTSLEATKDTTIEQILDEVNGRIASGDLPETAMTKIADIAKSMGYDGYQYINNIEGIKKNGLMLFDESKAFTSGEFTANKEIVTDIRDQLSREPENPDNRSTQRIYSPEREADFEQMKSAPLLKDEDMDPVLQGQKQQADTTLKTLSEDDPELQAEMQELRRKEANYKQEAQVLQDFADCYLNNMT